MTQLTKFYRMTHIILYMWLCYIIKLQNQVMENDVTLGVTNSKIKL